MNIKGTWIEVAISMLVFALSILAFALIAIYFK